MLPGVIFAKLKPWVSATVLATHVSLRLEGKTYLAYDDRRAIALQAFQLKFLKVMVLPYYSLTFSV